MNKFAVLSDDGLHRYWLTRSWGANNTSTKAACFVMLNPSTADATDDDPTIRRCIDFAKREGCDALRVVNLFSLRATDPQMLKRVHGSKITDITNDGWIRHAVGEARARGGPVIAAWGQHGYYQGRSNVVRDMIWDRYQPTLCLGKTKAGQPRHPLYLAKSTPLEPL